MVEKIDKETEASLIKALESAKACSQELQKKREKKRWQPVEVPCSLYNALIRLTKDELDQIRRNYHFKGLSGLKKAALTSALARLIPLNFERVIYLLDQGRYHLIKTIVHHSGFIHDRDIPVSQAEALMRFSTIFPGTYHDEKILFIPDELIAAFSQSDGNKLKSVTQRNTDWIKLTYGLLHYYGVMEPQFVKRKIEGLTGQKVDMPEFMNVMDFACAFYDQARYTPPVFQDARVFDAKKIMEERHLRADVDDFPFTKKQLLRAGAPDYFDKTPEMEDFIQFLLQNDSLTADEVNEISMQLNSLFINGGTAAWALQYLESCLDSPSLKFAQQLLEKLVTLYNNTRQWALKGHTPTELFQEEIKSHQTGSKTVVQKTHTKIRRNDPCPCGSGKKYKKCCGKRF